MSHPGMYRVTFCMTAPDQRLLCSFHHRGLRRLVSGEEGDFGMCVMELELCLNLGRAACPQHSMSSLRGWL